MRTATRRQRCDESPFERRLRRRNPRGRHGGVRRQARDDGRKGGEAPFRGLPRASSQGSHAVTGAPGKIIWTEVDEAPALATYSLLPIIRKFTGGTGITIETADISLAGRILANFPEGLTAGQRVPDWLTPTGEPAQPPEANIVKLPNISASVPQLKAAIRELQAHGYKVPDYPENPASPGEQQVKTRYARVLCRDV